MSFLDELRAATPASVDLEEQKIRLLAEQSHRDIKSGLLQAAKEGKCRLSSGQRVVSFDYIPPAPIQQWLDKKESFLTDHIKNLKQIPKNTRSIYLTIKPEYWEMHEKYKFELLKLCTKERISFMEFVIDNENGEKLLLKSVVDNHIGSVDLFQYCLSCSVKY